MEKPWGKWHLLDSGEGFKVKKIIVYPGHRLSLQLHSRRSEHWIVVGGCAHIRVGNENFVLNPCEHIFIPKGSLHRLENKSDKDLVVIEVSVGDYLEEDDIVRIENDYGRENK